MFSIEREKNQSIEVSIRFRITTFVKIRGLWSPEPDEGRIQLSTKERSVYATPLARYRTWRNEHQWSASSSSQSENSSAKPSDANQFLGFSSFRVAANEIERLQKEARELTRRKAEEEHAEEIQAHDGKLIDYLATIIRGDCHFLVAKLSDQLIEFKTKRVELEAARETIVRRMQQLHAQISVRRKEGSVEIDSSHSNETACFLF